MSLLDIEALTAGYGDAVILENLSLSVDEGEGVAMLGRNGVGKTTLILAIMGHVRRFKGQLSLAGSGFQHPQRQRTGRAGARLGPAGA